MRVFVYGSLMSGYHNHGFLAGAEALGRTQTKARFRMLNLGAFPGVIGEPDIHIHGELYEVGVRGVLRLDALEGHPNFYERRVVPLRSGGTAWMYILVRERNAPEVLSGDWRDVRPPDTMAPT